MARNTNRNYIKPMFRGVAFVMMVLRSLFATSTLQRINFRQFPFFNSFLNNLTSFTLLRMLQVISLHNLGTGYPAFFSLFMAFLSCFAFFTLAITFVPCFSFFGLAITVLTYFAIRRTTIFLGAILVKFRQGFDFFAFGTSFGYDLLRHNQLLNSWLCLEPYARSVRVSGSIYFKEELWTVKKKISVI